MDCFPNGLWAFGIMSLNLWTIRHGGTCNLFSDQQESLCILCRDLLRFAMPGNIYIPWTYLLPSEAERIFHDWHLDPGDLPCWVSEILKPLYSVERFIRFVKIDWPAKTSHRIEISHLLFQLVLAMEAIRKCTVDEYFRYLERCSADCLRESQVSSVIYGWAKDSLLLFIANL